MALYLISYDLNKPEKDYPKLIDYLEQIGAHRVLYSEWLVRIDLDRDGLLAATRAHVDSNDGLMVCPVESATGINLKYPISKI